MTVQIGTNLHNDYSDYVQGADRKETRVGHLRATAQGWITPLETCCAATFTLSITAITGVALIFASNQCNNILLWFLIISSVFNAFAYTAGPYPLGYIGLGHCSIAYYGLGDIFVFLYFGLVATYMIPYLLYLVLDESYNGNSSLLLILYGIQIGLLATNIIVVNNLRDCSTDVLANKRTTTVRFGKTFSKLQFCGNFLVTYILVLVTSYIQSQQQQLSQLPSRNFNASWMPLITAVPAYQEIQAILRKTESDLNPHVGGTAKVQFLFCLLLTMRLIFIQ